ncbi:MAG: hypothetical protein Kow001_13860 [Acidobacteriota bacterium]
MIPVVPTIKYHTPQLGMVPQITEGIADRSEIESAVAHAEKSLVHATKRAPTGRDNKRMTCLRFLSKKKEL